MRVDYPVPGVVEDLPADDAGAPEDDEVEIRALEVGHHLR